MTPLTQFEMNDGIRHRLGLSTALEAGIAAGNPQKYGGVGYPHPNQPNPTNVRLREVVRDTISDLNIKCNIGGRNEPLSASVEAQTADGPLRIDLATAFTPRDSQVNSIARCWWNDGSQNTVLIPTDFRQLDHYLVDFYSYAPSTPQYFWTDGYILWVSPAPSVAGTLYVLAGMALFAPATDNDTIRQLPADLYPVVMDGAALRICADQPDNRIMNERAAILGPMYQQGVIDMKFTMSNMTSQFQPRYVVTDQYRIPRGYR